GHVLHVRGALVDGRHAPWIRVDADHVVTGLGERHGERQTDVAQPDDPDSHDAGSVRPVTALATCSAAWPSPYRAGWASGGERSSAAWAASASRPARTFQPVSTVSTHSVVSRRVTHGTSAR